MPSTNFWDPQLEAKLHAWHQMQMIAEKDKPAPCITISREFGCQAYPVAEELIRRFNARVAGNPWVVIGRELLEEVSRLSGYSVEQIEKSQDTPASLKSLFSIFLDSSRAEETEVFSHMKAVIRTFAERGNCVIVGRGAVCVTQDLTNCIHLRLVAPERFRLEKIMKNHNFDETEARQYTEQHQKQREDFVRRFTGDDIDNSRLFHLVMNNDRMTVEDIATIVDTYLTRHVNRA